MFNTLADVYRDLLCDLCCDSDYIDKRAISHGFCPYCEEELYCSNGCFASFSSNAEKFYVYQKDSPTPIFETESLKDSDYDISQSTHADFSLSENINVYELNQNLYLFVVLKANYDDLKVITEFMNDLE